MIQRLKQFTDRISSANFNPCLTEEEIHAFEHRYSVHLPEAYRQFLLHVGNGGQGLYPLERENSQANHALENLHRAFPYLYPSPLPTFEEFTRWYKSNPKAVEQFVDVAVFRKNYYSAHKSQFENQLALFNIKTFFEGEVFLEDLYEAYLYSPHHRDGALILGDFGQELSYLLVVTGKRKGTVWADSREKIYPLFGPEGPLDFLGWLEEML